MRLLSPKCRIRTGRPPHATGFTLVELLIVVGIVALLFGLALMGLTVAKRKAQITRVQDDFQMISVALAQYRSDFQDIPRFADPSADVASTSGQWLDYANDRGARLLCQALIAPGPATSSNPSVPAGQDGFDGPGFRVRRSANGVLGGKVYGPYLAADKFKLEFNSVLFPNMADAKIMDSMGNVILYYPALPGPPLVGVLYVKNVNPQSPGSPPLKPLYNAYDNTSDTTTGKAFLSESEMQYMLGDTANLGYIGSGETAATTAPYLLWTAGLDGLYGRKNGKSDDIANFDFAGAVKK